MSSILSRLQAEAARLRCAIRGTRPDVAVGQDEIHVREAQLVEINEQLVLAALEAEQIAEKALRELARVTAASQRDPLTLLPNRALILDRIERAVASAERGRVPAAVLFVDLDGFKQINDQHGHRMGDQVLQEVARRLEVTVRDSDSVGRMGGDEFLVVLPVIAQRTDAEQVASKLLAAIEVPNHVCNVNLQLSASVGIAIYPRDGLDTSSLINRADEAMYRAKRRGGGKFEHAHKPETGRSLVIQPKLTITERPIRAMRSCASD